MAGPHAHDGDEVHEVTPTDAPTASIGLFFGTQTGKTEQVCGTIKNELGDIVSDAIDISEGNIIDSIGPNLTLYNHFWTNVHNDIKYSHLI